MSISVLNGTHHTDTRPPARPELLARLDESLAELLPAAVYVCEALSGVVVR